MSDVFRNKFALFCFGHLLIQQLIVASSNWFLVRISDSVASGSVNLSLLGLFVASLTLVYVPNVAAMIGVESWKQSLYRGAIDHYLNSYAGRIDLLGDAKHREEKHSYFVREVFSVIDSVTGYFYGLTATALNVVLNVIVISAVLDWSFLFAYLMSGILSMILIKRAIPAMEKKSSLAQSRRVSFTDGLVSSWSTILVGNSYNLDLLRQRLYFLRDESEQASVSARSAIEWTGFFSTLIVMLPVIVTMTFLVLNHRSDTALLLGLVATLHRQVLIIQYLESLVNSGIEFGAIRGLWNGLLTSLTPPERSTFDQRIASERIQIATSGSEACCAIDSDVDLRERTKGFGRTLLRGPNGSGKSSLLMKIKQELGSEAYYLPAHVDFVFATKLDALSSGQKITKALREIQSQTLHPVYLLDEWDAALDRDALRDMEGLINQLAERSCVIEVRHRT